jgi:hypothetical protein
MMLRFKVNEKLLAFASTFYRRNEIVVKSPRRGGKDELLSEIDMMWNEINGRKTYAYL